MRTYLAGYGRRTTWHAAFWVQLPRGEAAHWFCDIHSLKDSAAVMLQPGRHSGLLHEEPNRALAPPDRCFHRASTVGTARAPVGKVHPISFSASLLSWPGSKSSHFFKRMMY